jgi:mannose-6-phosphate isomerase-like protein (cupin superfamily)
MQVLLLSIVVVLALLAPSSGPPQTSDRRQTAPPHHTIVPLPNFWEEAQKLNREGHSFEIVSGDPDKPGAPFVIRIYNVENQIIPPHWHPEDEHLTVVKGTWAIGEGDTFDKNVVREMGVGDYVEVPKTMHHFAWAKTPVVTQIHGIGPFKQINVDPWVFLSDPKSAATFKLKLKDRVRSPRGEGVVVFGASSDKNRITQYFVQRDDGTVFAEFEAELTKMA